MLRFFPRFVLVAFAPVAAVAVTLAVTGGGAAPAAAAPAVTKARLAGPAVDHGEAVTGRAEVEVKMDRGTLRVRGAKAGAARASGRLGADVAGLDLQRQGHWLRYEVTPRDSPPGTPLELASELLLELPPGSDLTVEGPAVDITLEGDFGRVDLRTLNGAVRLSGRPAQLEVQTVSGPISTAELDCPLAVLRSAAGAVELGGRFEELTARTAESPLTVKATISDEARLESAAGRVSFEGELGPVARLAVKTMGGEARLLLARELEASYRVSSFEGELDNALGPPFGRPGLRRESLWRQGKAERRVEVETFDGKISLLAR